MTKALHRIWPAQASDLAVAGTLLACLCVLIAAHVLFPLRGSALLTGLNVLIFCTAGWVSMQRPAWGIIIIMSLLPVEALLPPVSFATSVYPLLGMATAGGYVYHHLYIRRERPLFTWTHLFALLFLLWISVSNPKAAFTIGTRVWFFTYLQLIVFMWLATQLFRTDRDRSYILYSFAVVATISALFAIPQVHFGFDSASSLRARGLAAGPNSAGWYFTLATIIAYHTATTSNRRVVRLTSIAVALVLLVAVAATVSRTAFIALLVGVILFSFLPRENRKPQLQFIAVLCIGFIVVLPVEFWRIASGIVTSIVSGTDSIGFRYMQWQTAMPMVWDHPFAGVGIGQFRFFASFYGVEFVPFYGTGYVAHSLFFAVLAETGLIGATIFSLMLLSTFAAMVVNYKQQEPRHRNLTLLWLTVSVLILIGGITADAQHDKLLWLAIGIQGIPVTSGVFSAAGERMRRFIRAARSKLLDPSFAEMP
jgi:O-antigen ligase